MTQTMGPLNPYRALDLTNEKGFLCGKILADLGADVIKIEKPGGDISRDRGPFYHNIPDYLIVAVVAALDHRNRTGKGQYIDLGQFEAGATFVAPAILDYTINGRVLYANGNRNPYAAPHGAFRCQGKDKWCAIAIFNDAQWEAFKQATGMPAWANEPKFATFTGRKKNECELEKLIEHWTSDKTAEEAMTMMQAAGVPAGVVESGKDLCEDMQLKHRHYFQWLEHPVVGVSVINGYSFKLSKTGYHLQRAPLLGEHTEYVCREILKMPDKKFIELLQKGVLE